MKTLPREPWRGGQICGYQSEYGVIPGRSVFCGEYKGLGLYFCPEHDQWVREECGQVRIAPGNAIGLEIVPSDVTAGYYIARDKDGQTRAGARSRTDLARMLGFDLQWEPHQGIHPIDPTDEELRAFEEMHTA